MQRRTNEYRQVKNDKKQAAVILKSGFGYCCIIKPHLFLQKMSLIKSVSLHIILLARHIFSNCKKCTPCTSYIPCMEAA